MRATTVTLGLGFTALAAVAIAPRLMVRAEPAELVVVALPAQVLPAPLPVTPAQSVAPTLPVRVDAVPEALVMKGGRGTRTDALIPELDARPNHRFPPVRVAPPEPVEPIEPIGWDCPACGMG